MGRLSSNDVLRAVQFGTKHAGREDDLVLGLELRGAGGEQLLEVAAALGLHSLVLDGVQDKKPKVAELTVTRRRRKQARQQRVFEIRGGGCRRVEVPIDRHLVLAETERHVLGAFERVLPGKIAM